MNSPVINHKAIKNYNRRKIINLLSVRRELTRQAISLKTGISIPTVASNIQELIDEGLVEEAGTAESTGGRKAVIVRYLPDARVSFGVEITRTKVRILLSNLDLEIRFESELVMEPFGRIDEVMNRTSEEIERILLSLGIPAEKVLGVGFSLPGTVNQKKMTLELAPNMGMKDILFKPFEEAFHYPIYIENEANSGALAELKLGKAAKSGELVYVSVGGGIGTGLIINGKLYKGKNQRAGEFGHMTVVPGGKLCNCGRRGCWETFASCQAALRYFKELQPQSKATSFQELLVLAEEGDQQAAQALAKQALYIGRGLRLIIAGLSPSLILIAGDITSAWHRFGPAIEKEAVELTLGGAVPRILPTHEGEIARLRGAAALVFQRRSGREHLQEREQRSLLTEKRREPR